MVPVVDGQRDSLQRVHGAHFALATGHIGVGQRQHDVFDNRQARQQVETLKDKANTQARTSVSSSSSSSATLSLAGNSRPPSVCPDSQDVHER